MTLKSVFSRAGTRWFSAMVVVVAALGLLTVGSLALINPFGVDSDVVAREKFAESADSALSPAPADPRNQPASETEPTVVVDPPKPTATPAIEKVPTTTVARRSDETYTWQDGDRDLQVELVEDMEAQTDLGNPGAKPEISAPGDSLPGSAVSTRSTANTQSDEEEPEPEPVFRSSSGGLMTLPGGVLVVLNPAWDRARVNRFFSSNAIKASQVSDLDFIDNGFLVSTAPGFASLELANALAGQNGVVNASPNWLSEAETK